MIHSCKCCEFEGVCMWKPPSNVVENCRLFVQRLKRTNNERVNHMSVEEKADWLFEHDRITEEKGRLSKEELIQWLNSIAEE